MGKKLSQSSLKISKDDKKQLNKLIKILRPKVYITEPSNFKRLVQELTGNGIPIPYPPPSMRQPLEEVPIIEIEDHAYEQASLELSVDVSEARVPTFITAFESSPEMCIVEDFNVLESSTACNDMGFSSYNDHESWQLEMDPFFYNIDAYIPKIQQEVCVYDYDLSGLL